MKAPHDWIVPDWPAPSRVKCIVTTRNGGVSTGPQASFNLGLKADDDPAHVHANRAQLRKWLPADPAWLAQVHGNRVVTADQVQPPVEADASTTRRADVVCAVMVADQIRDFLEVGNVRNSVNFPEAVMALLPGVTRLCIVNANVPNMVGQITTALAKHNLNISDLLNKSRGDIAYTMVDVDAPVSDAVFKEISSIQGVLATRVIPAR